MSPNAKDLFQACEENDLEAARALIDQGHSPNESVSEGYTPLMLCAGNQQQDLAELLLKSGANPNLKNEGGSSALKIACLKGDLSLVKTLLSHKADPDQADAKGYTPLMYCVMNGNTSLVSALIEAGADPKKKSLKGEKSAIDFAEKLGNEAIAKLLKAKSQKKKKVEEINPDHLVGQKSAKTALAQIISLSKVNRERTKRELPTSQVTLHAIFSGNPGTGKTTFARYYAQEVKKLGILEKGHLVEVSRSELVAEFVGQTASKTTKVFESALGGILFVDEAYALKTGKDDLFGQECIDTLIKLMEDHRDELIVIFAGYTEEMREFSHTNPGLKSRVPNHIEFDDYNDDEIGAIFDIMLKKTNLTIDKKDRKLAVSEITKERKGKSFGNGRSVRNFIDRAIAQQSIRLGKKDLSKLSKKDLCHLIYSDLTEDPDDEGTRAEILKQKRKETEKTAIDELEELVGLNAIKTEIRQISDFVKISRARNSGALPDIGLHMVFMGNPGTGKTTVARLLGKIFHELGFLSEGHLVEADRSKLVAPYVGQTAIKTVDLIEDALGGVLFVDEAYTLYRGAHSRDSFGQEAIDTLLKYMEDYRNRFILVLSGYPNEMETFLSSNPGLNSRFNRKLTFGDFSDEELLEIADRMAEEAGFEIADGAKSKIRSLVEEHRKSDDHFANARTIRNLLESAFKKQASRLMKAGKKPDSLDEKTLRALEDEDF